MWSNYHQKITYPEWCELMGKYRWFRQDGSPRTYYDLQYNYPKIYELVTRNVDLRFHNRTIDDVNEFTSAFLSTVPVAWLKFKAQLEFLNGTYDGNVLEPDIFEQGFTRTIEHVNNRNLDESSETTGNIESETTLGEHIDDIKIGEHHDDTSLGQHSDSLSLGQHTDNITLGSRSDTNIIAEDLTVDSKNRNIAYNQGSQAYDPLNDNIGQLGRDYASGIVDTVAPSESETNRQENSDIGEQHNTNQYGVQNNLTDYGAQQNSADYGAQENQNTFGAQENTATQDSTNSGKYHGEEDVASNTKIHETRINMYDNIAFLRLRMEFINSIKMFEEYFEGLFTEVDSMKRWYNYEKCCY